MRDLRPTPGAPSSDPPNDLAEATTFAPSPEACESPSPTQLTVTLGSTLVSQSSLSDEPSEETRPLADASDWLGHYELRGELGRGGMGVVYAAYDTKLQRKVAIKRLLAGRHGHQRRLIREALAMAKLSHPNVITIHEIGERGVSAYIVMEFVEGRTLSEWQASPRTRDEILAVYGDAARGLIAAHDKHLVHRDFKPDNVMIGDDGRVRVMDFGLASVATDPHEDTLAPGRAARDSAAFDPLTRTGSLLGTPAYMAPEQLRAEPADAASDQFGFCVSLYEALYGSRPFFGRTLAELCRAVCQGELAGAPAGASVAPWLRELLQRGLAPRREDRFASMRALLDALVAGRLAEQTDEREPPAYVFVAHASRDKSTVLRLCHGLLDHGVRPWLDIWELGADQDWRSSLALAQAPAVIVCGHLDHDPTLTARARDDPSTVYVVTLPGADAPALGERHAGVELDEARWDATILELAQLVGVDRERARWLEWEAEQAGVDPAQLSPYRGLEAFREQDARWMFGREDEVEVLLDLFGGEQTRFSILIGASGSGKSSLVMAGLCPALRHGALGDGQRWSIAYLRPGPRPCEALAHALVHLDAVERSSVQELRAELIEASDALRLFLGRRRGGRILLVIDQLEELFTEAGLGADTHDAAEAHAFVSNLLEATRELAALDGNLWIAATLRADFVQRALEHSALALALQLGTYFALPPMREAQIRAAIERPAARVGYRVEPELVDELVAAAAHQAGHLPLLQHVLRELWARRDDERRVLNSTAYAETGGLDGAIATAAEQALTDLRVELGERGEHATRRLMTRLVHLGDRSSGDTRRRVPLAEIDQDAATQRALEIFVAQARVLVATEVDDVETLEFAHEALLREWTTLVAWLDADRDGLRLRQELARDASREPDQAKQEYLWARGRVEEARRLLAASTVELNANEEAFLAASERAVRAQLRRVRGVVIGFMITAVAVIVLVLIMNRQIRAQKLAAEDNATQLEQEKQAQQDSLSVQQGLRAQLLVAGDHEAEALTLAIEAVGSYGPSWEREPPPEARAGLETVLADDALVITDFLQLSEGAGAKVLGLSVHPKGRIFARADNKGFVELWDLHAGTRLERWKAHDGIINNIVHSPDGVWLATASMDHSAKLWDATTGALVQTYVGHDQPVHEVVYSPDGETLATAGWDGTARIWSLHSDEPSSILRGHASGLQSIAYAPDGAQLATGDAVRVAKIWDLDSGEELATLTGHRTRVSKLAYSPDSSQLASVSADEIRLWDAQSGELRTILTGHIDQITAIAYTFDGAQIVSASLDSSAKIWTVEGRLLATLSGHTSAITRMALAPDGAQLATGSADKTARLWELPTGRPIATLRGHPRGVSALAYTPDGSRLITGDTREALRMWPADRRNQVKRQRGHDDKIVAVVYSPDGARVATASRDQSAKIWDPETGELVATLAGHSGPITGLRYAPDSATLATVSVDESVRIWSAADGEAIATGRQIGKVRALAYAPDGAVLATGGTDESVWLWDPATGASLGRTPLAIGDLDVLTYSHDGALLAAGSKDGGIVICDSMAEDCGAPLTGHTRSIEALAFAPDDSQLASASYDATARLWDPATGETLATLAGHVYEIADLRYSPDGTILATASWDNTVKLWDTATGALLRTLVGHEDRVYALAFSPDGASLASASLDASARLWDLATGASLKTLRVHGRDLPGHGDDLHHLAFAPDGHQFVVAGNERSAAIWDPRTGALRTTLSTRVGLREADGSLSWSVSNSALVGVACDRLAPLPEYREVSALCPGY